jgi:hypothetical protein
LPQAGPSREEHDTEATSAIADATRNGGSLPSYSTEKGTSALSEEIQALRSMIADFRNLHASLGLPATHAHPAHSEAEPQPGSKIDFGTSMNAPAVVDCTDFKSMHRSAKKEHAIKSLGNQPTRRRSIISLGSIGRMFSSGSLRSKSDAPNADSDQTKDGQTSKISTPSSSGSVPEIHVSCHDACVQTEGAGPAPPAVPPPRILLKNSKPAFVRAIPKPLPSPELKIFVPASADYLHDERRVGSERPVAPANFSHHYVLHSGADFSGFEGHDTIDHFRVPREPVRIPSFTAPPSKTEQPVRRDNVDAHEEVVERQKIMSVYHTLKSENEAMRELLEGNARLLSDMERKILEDAAIACEAESRAARNAVSAPIHAADNVSRVFSQMDQKPVQSGREAHPSFTAPSFTAPTRAAPQQTASATLPASQNYSRTLMEREAHPSFTAPARAVPQQTATVPAAQSYSRSQREREPHSSLTMPSRAPPQQMEKAKSGFSSERRPPAGAKPTFALQSIWDEVPSKSSSAENPKRGSSESTTTVTANNQTLFKAPASQAIAHPTQQVASKPPHGISAPLYAKISGPRSSSFSAGVAAYDTLKKGRTSEPVSGSLYPDLSYAMEEGPVLSGEIVTPPSARDDVPARAISTSDNRMPASKTTPRYPKAPIEMCQGRFNLGVSEHKQRNAESAPPPVGLSRRVVSLGAPLSRRDLPGPGLFHNTFQGPLMEGISSPKIP